MWSIVGYAHIDPIDKMLKYINQLYSYFLWFQEEKKLRLTQEEKNYTINKTVLFKQNVESVNQSVNYNTPFK